MTRIHKNILLVFCLLASVNGFAQNTTSSPYSQFGIGLLRGPQLPQTRGMGGVAAALRRPGSYNNINLANPASYSAIDLSTFDIGLTSGFSSVQSNTASGKDFNASLGHLVFAIPVSKKSALGFGVVPFSSVGYRSSVAGTVDTNAVNYVRNGDGGLSKAYLGYGFQIGKHLSLGANLSYIFGKLERNQDVEFVNGGFLNSRTQKTNSLSGLNADYGLQFYTNVSKKVKFNLGYFGSAATKLNSSLSTVGTLYTVDNLGNESVASDTSYASEIVKSKLKLPSSHTIGFAFERTNKWFLGADVNYTNWAESDLNGSGPAFENAFGVAVGGQITPDIGSVSNYFKLVDYRLGVRYNKTALNLNNNDIKETALTFGFGFPLPANRSTFYKINLGVELGQRGTMDNNLVRERFANVHLGFTINDKWFQRYKFD